MRLRLYVWFGGKDAWKYGLGLPNRAWEVLEKWFCVFWQRPSNKKSSFSNSDLILHIHYRVSQKKTGFA